MGSEHHHHHHHHHHNQDTLSRYLLNSSTSFLDAIIWILDHAAERHGTCQKYTAENAIFGS